MFKKKKYFNAPYETLSDLAIGSLGVFIILVIVLVVISSFSKGKNNPSEQVIEKNQQLQAKIESVEDEYENRKSQDLASKEIEQMKREYDSIKAELSDRKRQLNKKKNQLANKKENLDELNSAIEILDQKRSKHADYLVELDKMEIQLESLVDHNTGSGVDKTGRPYLIYGTYTPNYYSTQKDTLFLIGSKGVLTKKQFFALLKSFKDEGKNSFFIRFSAYNSKFTQDRYEPQWSKALWNKAGWRTTDVSIKDGYK